MTGYPAPVAPPGQSLNDLNQQRFQQQQPLQNQSTGYGQQPNGYLQNHFAPMQPQQTGPAQYAPLQQQRTGPQMQPQQTGFYQPQQPQQFQNPQQFMNGQQTGSPFADPPRAPFQPQPTGFQSNNFQNTQAPQQMSQPTGANSFLPPALQPQQTGLGGYGGNQGFGQQQQQQPPPVPPIPQQPTAAQPLQPQQTGPAPSVKFGVQQAAQKLTPQPTGRANLANASKSAFSCASSHHEKCANFYNSSIESIRLLAVVPMLSSIRQLTLLVSIYWDLKPHSVLH